VTEKVGSKVKIEFLEDFGEVKKGTITQTKSEDALEMEKNGIVQIIKESTKREKIAKFYRDKHVLEDNPKTPEWQATMSPEEIVKSKKGFGIGLGISSENFKKIKSENAKDPLIQKYLIKKNIFDYITKKELDKLIVGEIPTRKTIFLCCQGRLVENCQIASYNLLLSSSAGVGKDYVASKVLSLFPEEQKQIRTRISATAFTYWHNATYEPDWTWDGKICYLEDISEGILNHEVFKVMTSSGSCATVVIKQRAYDIKIKGKPVVITTTATATPTPEIVRRFEFCNLDESMDQTKEIMKRHAEYAKSGKSTRLNEEITEAMRLLKRKKVKIPFAEKLCPYFPENNVMMRTKFVRFLDLIKASCAFHQYQRKEDSDGFLIAEKQDYNIAKEVIEKLSTNKYMIPLTINQQRIMHFFEQNADFFGNSASILNKTGHFLAQKNLQNNLNLLVFYGLIEKEIDKDEFNRDREFYKLPEFLKNTKDIFTLPTIDKILKRRTS
jgi:hypothetical protein